MVVLYYLIMISGREMAESMEDVITSLKGMIDRNGPHHLTNEPYQVYEELKDSGITDRKTAGAILLLTFHFSLLLTDENIVAPMPSMPL